MAAPAAKPPASTASKVTKVSLLVGAGIALAASKTEAAPLVVIILIAAVVYQLLTF